MGQIKNIKLHIVTDIKYKSSIASSATTMTVTASPLILWAQRADKVFVSVQLGDITNQEINLEKDKLSFKADAQGKKWETTIEFDGTVKPEESTQTKMQNVKVDFNRWKDEDDDDEDEMAGGMGGMGGKYDDASLEDMMQQMGTSSGEFDPDEGCSDDS